MTVMAGSALVGGMVFAKELYHYWKPRRVGVYGPTMVGKTTLDRYMTTPGEMEEIGLEERTKHFKVPGLNRFLLPRPTRKRVSWKGGHRVVYSADIGGEERFWNLWIDDMVNRQVEVVVFMFDHRSTAGGDDAIQAVGGFKYLVDALLHRQYRYRLGEHVIFGPFREDLIRLQKAGIPTKRSMMATKIGWNVENTMLDLLSL